MTTPRRGARRRSATPLDFAQARRAAIDLLARKSWTERELARRLEQRGAPPDVAREVVADLRSRGYLDDAGFARWWAQARAQGRRVGSARLRRELLGKGVAPDVIASAVSAAFEVASELDRAMEAGRRRLPVLARSRRGDTGTRLADYLLRRGYPSAVARQVVKSLLAVDPGEGADGPEDASV